MNDDVFPHVDAEFHELQAQFIAAIRARPDAYGASAADLSALEAGQARWNEDYLARRKAELDALTAVGTSDQARALLEAIMLAVARSAYSQQGITVELLVEAALTPRDEVDASIIA